MMSESVANATVPVKKRWGALKQAVVEPTTTTPGSSADAMQSNGGFKKKGVSALRERMRAFEEKANMQETSEKMPEPPPPPWPTPVVNTKAVESAPLVEESKVPPLAEQWACGICKRSNDASAPVCGTCFTPHSYRSKDHTNNDAIDEDEGTTRPPPEPDTARQGRLGARLASTANKEPNKSRSTSTSSDAPNNSSDSSVGSDLGSSSSGSSDPSSRLTPQYLEPLSEDRSEHPFFPPPSLAKVRVSKGPQDETVSGICSNCEGVLKACAAYCGICGARRQDASVVHSIDCTEEEADAMRAELASTPGRLALAEAPKPEPEFSKLGARLAKNRSNNGSGAPSSCELASADAQGKSAGAAGSANQNGNRKKNSTTNHSSNYSNVNSDTNKDQRSGSTVASDGGKVLLGFKAAMAAKAAAVAAAGSAGKSGSNATISWKDKSSYMKVPSTKLSAEDADAIVSDEKSSNRTTQVDAAISKESGKPLLENEVNPTRVQAGSKTQGNKSFAKNNDATSDGNKNNSSSSATNGGGKVLLGFKAAMVAKAAAVAAAGSAGKSGSNATVPWSKKTAQSKVPSTDATAPQALDPKAAIPAEDNVPESETISMPEESGENPGVHVTHQDNNGTTAADTATADTAAVESIPMSTKQAAVGNSDTEASEASKDAKPAEGIKAEVPKKGTFTPPRRHSKLLWNLMGDKIREDSPSEARRKNALMNFEQGRYSFKELPTVAKSKQGDVAISEDQDVSFPPNAFDSPNRNTSADDLSGGDHGDENDSTSVRGNGSGNDGDYKGSVSNNGGSNGNLKVKDPESFGEDGRNGHNDESSDGSIPVSGELMMNKTSERLAAAATRIAESAAAASMKEPSRNASRSKSIGEEASGYLSSTGSSSESSQPLHSLPPHESTAGFTPTSSSNSPRQADDNNAAAMVVAAKPTVSVRQEIERKQAAARLGATYEAEKLAQARSAWTFRPHSSNQDQDAMGAALKKLSPLISTKAAIDAAPTLSAQRHGFFATVHKQVEENSMRDTRTGSDGADFSEPPDLIVGPPSPSPWQRRGGGSLLLNEEDDLESKESLSRHEAAGRGQNLLLQVAQMNEAAAASVQAIHAAVGDQGTLLTNGSSASADAKDSSAPLLLTSSAADTSAPLAFSLDWRGTLTPEQIASDARDIALGWSLQSKPAAYSSLVSLHVCYDEDDGQGTSALTEKGPTESMPGADGEWTDQFLSLSDASLWAATHFNVNGATGAVSTTPSSNLSSERFKFVADLRSPGCAVTFERCAKSTTGFCAVVHQPYRGFTLRLALKKFKHLLDWGAALMQAMSELPPPSARDMARQAQQAPLVMSSPAPVVAVTGGAHEAKHDASNTLEEHKQLTQGDEAAAPAVDDSRQEHRSRKRYSASAPRVLPSVTEEDRSAPQGEIEPVKPSAMKSSSSTSSASSSLHTFGEAPDGTNPWGVVLRPVGNNSRSLTAGGKELSRPTSTRNILPHHQQQQRHHSPSPSRQLSVYSQSASRSGSMTSDRSLTQRGLWMTSNDDDEDLASRIPLTQSFESKDYVHRSRAYQDEHKQRRQQARSLPRSTGNSTTISRSTSLPRSRVPPPFASTSQTSPPPRSSSSNTGAANSSAGNATSRSSRSLSNSSRSFSRSSQSNGSPPQSTSSSPPLNARPPRTSKSMPRHTAFVQDQATTSSRGSESSSSVPAQKWAEAYRLKRAARSQQTSRSKGSSRAAPLPSQSCTAAPSSSSAGTFGAPNLSRSFAPYPPVYSTLGYATSLRSSWC